MNRLPISAVVLTHNEERNIEDCLKSVCGWIDDIFVVDSGSTDGTLAIVKRYTNKVYFHPFQTHSKQWKWALQNTPTRNKWILGIDADQRITEELAHEMVNIFSNVEKMRNVDGFYLNRKQYFMERWIKHGGYYPRYLLKLFRKDKVIVDVNELMDHHFYVQGKTAKFKGAFIEENKNETLDFWSMKHIKYASLQAQGEVGGLDTKIIKPSLFGNWDQRRLLMKNIWIRLPLFIRPFIYFLYRYFFRLGFLDGKEGLIFHYLQGFWYRFLVDAKIYEYKKRLKDNHK
jgi:glycosyltransferase involved in cell wall biosynthesis